MQTVLPGFSFPSLPESFSGNMTWKDEVIPFSVTWSREEKTLVYSKSDSGILIITAPSGMTTTDVLRFLKKESDRIGRFFVAPPAEQQPRLLSGPFLKPFVQSDSSWIANKFGKDLQDPGDNNAILFMEYGTYRIPYRIRTSSKAKRIILKITADKHVEVVIPPGTDSGLATRFIRDKGAWVVDKVTNTSRLEPPVRNYADGDLLPLLGTVYRLSVIIGKKRIIAERKDGLIVVTIPKEADPFRYREAVKRGYELLLHQTLQNFISPLIISWSERLSVQVPVIRYGNQKTKWGVCSPRGIILNIRLAMAPSDLIEYVIVHELCHIRHPNHSKRFWNLVETMLPDYRDRKTRLNNEGPSYSL